MTTLRSWVLGIGLCLVAGFSASCGGKTPCGPDSCAGCCSEAGDCETGWDANACGLQGVTCNACGASQTCDYGACLFANTSLLDIEPTEPLAIVVSVAPSPPHQGANTLSVVVQGANNGSAQHATVSVAYMMPSMPGMGTGHATGVEVGGGEYSVGGINFSMGGGWRVTVTVTLDSPALSASQDMYYTL